MECGGLFLKPRGSMITDDGSCSGCQAPDILGCTSVDKLCPQEFKNSLCIRLVEQQDASVSFHFPRHVYLWNYQTGRSSHCRAKAGTFRWKPVAVSRKLLWVF